MSIEQQIYSERRTVRICISNHLWSEAERLKIDISRAVEKGLDQALTARREELWLEKNKSALDSSNSFVEQHGLPLEKYRIF